MRRKEVVVAHPWPEWIELVERLVKQNYFDHGRKDEDKVWGLMMILLLLKRMVVVMMLVLILMISRLSRLRA